MMRPSPVVNVPLSSEQSKPQSQLDSWLKLVHTPGVGPATLHKLLGFFESADALVNARHSALTAAGLKPALATALQSGEHTAAVETDLRWRDDGTDRWIIALDSPRYPAQLKHIANPPPVLYVRGDIEAMYTPQLAIVGSRKPSSYGRRTATRLARELADCGLTITSGLAHGIDAEAHGAALSAGAMTIAVTGTGLDRVYPARHHALAHQIAESGALVSEFPIGTEPRPASFPRRNRIISGLSYGTLVIEAALKSGSLTTAGHATEQSREVFAIPGNIDNPLARGCHALIRKGAILVENAQDVLEQIGPMLPTTLEMPHTDHRDAGANLPAAPSETALQLLEHIEFEPVTLDELVVRTGMPVAQLAQLVTELEMQSRIEATAGGGYCRIR